MQALPWLQWHWFQGVPTPLPLERYPLVNANVPGEGLPLYLRLENNYIGQEAIQEKIDAGLIQTFDKQQGRRTGHQSGPKVNLLAKENGSKEGGA
eukprot:g20975.t1